MPEENLCESFQRMLASIALENENAFLEEELEEKYGSHLGKCAHCLIQLLEKVNQLFAEEDASAEEDVTTSEALCEAYERDLRLVEDAVKRFLERFPQLAPHRFGLPEDIKPLALFYAVDAVDDLLERYVRRTIPEDKRNSVKLNLRCDGSVFLGETEAISSEAMAGEISYTMESEELGAKLMQWVVIALLNQPTLLRDFDVSSTHPLVLTIRTSPRELNEAWG
ncbi:MAG: hypothetical protein WAP51_00880 [Candidatus Sungiibacteriota bacterium]